MATEMYNVVFQGEIAAGRSQEQVKQALAQIFKRQPHELDQFFTGNSVLIQQQVDQQTAARYKNAFEKAGAICSVVPVETPELSEVETTAPEDPDQHYHLVFRGEILPGKQIDVVKQILAAKFKLTSQQVTSYFSGKPCQLTKTPVDKATVIKYQRAFEKAGARCHPMPVRSEASPQKPDPALQKVQAVNQTPTEVPPAVSHPQDSGDTTEPASQIVPPPLPDVLPPMPIAPSPPRRTPPSLQKPKKKNSNLWILAIVLPFAFIFFFGIVAAIAVPNLLTAIQRSKIARTKADMRAIGAALGSFQVDTKAFPVTDDWEYFSEETLPAEYYSSVYWDAWNNRFFYQSDGTTYQLISYGKDMQEGGSGFDADIVYTNGVFGE